MVIDASALIELLLNLPEAAVVRQRIAKFPGRLKCPYLIDAEVAHVIRRFEARGSIDQRRGAAALRTLVQFPMLRFPHAPLIERVWTLRHNLTAYDALYVALAEALAEPLLTRDRRLAAASGHNARIEAV